MIEFSNFREMVDAGYDAIEGIKSDVSLSLDEKAALTRLDPTVEQVQSEIADIFAAEEAEAKHLRQALQDEQDRK